MNNQTYIINLMKAAMTGSEFNLDPSLDKKLYQILKEQTFLSMHHYVTKSETTKPFYLATHLLYEEIDKLKALLKTIFDSNKIDHIFLKGSSFYNLYPNKNIRLLGDIDILIRPKDVKKVIDLLKKNDFIYGERCSHHISFHYYKIEIEIHFAIIEKKLSISDYLAQPFENAILDNNHTYTLLPEFNLVFIIAHYMKHLQSGSGLRSMCDIYVLIKHYNIDLNKVRIIFQKYKCEKFFDCLLTCLNIIFDYNDYPFNYNEHAKELINYSLNSGIHGFGKNNNPFVNKQQAISNNKFFYLLKTWFIPIKQLFDFYPWTKTIILIPLGYIVRLFHLIFKRKKQLKSVLFNKTTNNSDLFKNIGLK